MNEKMGVHSPHVTEGTIHAWLDGALSADEGSAVESHVGMCDLCSAAVAEARGLIAGSTRILTALDDAPGDVIPRTDRTSLVTEMPKGRGRSHASTNVRVYTSIAAVAALAIVTTLVLRRQPSPARKVIPEAIPSLAASARSAGSAPAAVKAQVATDSAPHQHGKSVDTRAAAPVGAAPTAGRVAAAPATAPASRAAVAADANVVANTAEEPRTAEKARAVAMAPQTQPVQVKNVEAVASVKAGNALAIIGRVTDATTGLPLASATVNVVGTPLGATTDSNGDFKIDKVPIGAQMVLARRIGFAPDRIRVNVPADSSVSVAFALPEASNSLSEVVVTGEAIVPSVDGFTKSPPTIDGARIVSSEIADAPDARIRRTVYEIGSGTQITLVERRLRVGVPRVARLGATVADAQRSIQESHSVSWAASDGTMLTLSGAVSAAELEALKSQIVVR